MLSGPKSSAVTRLATYPSALNVAWIFWQSDSIDPKRFQPLNRIHQIVQRRWLTNVGICMSVISTIYIVFGARRAKDNDGNQTLVRIGFETSQHLVTAHFGQI